MHALTSAAVGVGGNGGGSGSSGGGSDGGCNGGSGVGGGRGGGGTGGSGGGGGARNRPRKACAEVAKVWLREQQPEPPTVAVKGASRGGIRHVGQGSGKRLRKRGSPP